MFNFQQAMQMMQQFQNPQQMLQRMGIPQEHIGSPQSVEQYLLNSGRISQQQIEQAKNMYQKMFGIKSE